MSGLNLLEREVEISTLREKISHVQQHGSGSSILIEGEAGVGKSSLLAVSRKLAEDAGVRVLSAQGSELEREFAFGVVRQLLEPIWAEGNSAERKAWLAGPAQPAERVLGP